MFDKELFAELLDKAKGERSINLYGQHCDVDPGYISRLLRKLREQPPSAEIINKLASRAHNGVTTEDLMAVAGYIDTPNPKPREVPDTIAPYLPEHFDELSPEAKEEILNFVEYIMVKYAKQEEKGGSK